MNCIYCQSSNIHKSGVVKSRQNYHCQVCRRKFLEPVIHSPEFIDSEFVLREKTFMVEGHFPELLSAKSSKRIWVVCPICKQERAVKRWVYKLNQSCRRCTNVRLANVLSQERKIYPSRREKQYAAQKRKLQTIEGVAIHRLRVLLRRSFNLYALGKEKAGCFRNLAYSPIEFAVHINRCLSNGCCICKRVIITGDKWDIAHLIPTSEARTEKEVIALFALTNLAVAHRICNIKLGNSRVRG